MKVSFKKYGSHGVLVQWPKRIDKDILLEMQAFIALIKKEDLDIKLCYHAYQEVYIELENKIIDFTYFIAQLKKVYQSINLRPTSGAKIWNIPVCYDHSIVADLESYLTKKKITLETLISMHSNTNYMIHFIGFLPGFPYLGGMDKRLAIRRKDIPSKQIVKGTVAIGGEQTGIYPENSPGGWYGIGYTPIQLFDPSKNNPCFAKAGDYIRFHAISKNESKSIETEISRGEYVIQSTNHAY